MGRGDRPRSREEVAGHVAAVAWGTRAVCPDMAWGDTVRHPCQSVWPLESMSEWRAPIPVADWLA